MAANKNYGSSFWVPGYPPYSENLFYSLYGWRTNPPYQYPQQTINTPFDVTMRNCTGWCNRSPDPKRCLNMCRLSASQAQGTLMDVSPPKGSVEEFEYSHGVPASPRHRFTGGNSDDQSCFYY